MDVAGGSLLAAMFVAGIASGVHCIGMCGGIVAVFGTRRTIALTPARAPGRADFARQLAFNGGRISSYTVAGAMAGLAGGAAAAMAGALPVQALLYAGANVMLVLVGLYLMGAARLLMRLEPLGGPLWRRLQPYAARGLAVMAPHVCVEETGRAPCLTRWQPAWRGAGCRADWSMARSLRPRSPPRRAAARSPCWHSDSARCPICSPQGWPRRGCAGGSRCAQCA